jgi:hypothetical protein
MLFISFSLCQIGYSVPLMMLLGVFIVGFVATKNSTSLQLAHRHWFSSLNIILVLEIHSGGLGLPQ